MLKHRQQRRFPSASIRRPANGSSSSNGAHRSSASAVGGQTFQQPRQQQRSELSLWSGDYPEGGVQVVLAKMAKLATEGAAKPHFQKLAMQVTSRLGLDSSGHPDRKDRRAVAARVYDFVTRTVAYKYDVHGVEQLQSPLATLQVGGGDCDDMAVLCATLLKALGVPTRFRVIATNPAAPSAYTHVYCEYQSKAGSWHSIDPVGNPGVDAEIAPGRVVGSETYELNGGQTGPTTLAVVRASESGAGELAGLAAPAAQLGADGGPKGPVAGPDAWVQITSRSHEGAVPSNQRFDLGLRVERSYPPFQPCSIKVVCREAETGEELATTEITGSKWTGGVFSNRCGGDIRLSFPMGWNPAGTAVKIEVYDTDLLSADDLLGESGALYLTEEDVSEYDAGGWDDVTAAAAGIGRAVQLASVAGIVIGGGAALSAAWPYVERVLPDFTKEN